jgi:hypothetical protein
MRGSPGCLAVERRRRVKAGQLKSIQTLAAWSVAPHSLSARHHQRIVLPVIASQTKLPATWSQTSCPFYAVISLARQHPHSGRRPTLSNGMNHHVTADCPLRCAPGSFPPQSWKGEGVLPAASNNGFEYRRQQTQNRKWRGHMPAMYVNTGCDRGPAQHPSSRSSRRISR